MASGLGQAYVVIPARWASTRLPEKMLADIGGEPMVVRVWRQALRAGPREVVVATDDDRIANACRAHGAQCQLTRADHASGTDRIAEVAQTRGWLPEEIVVNLQGDEPFMPAANLERLVDRIVDDRAVDMATLVEPLTQQEQFLDPAVVKVVRDERDRAIYFSRSPIPYPRDQAQSSPPAMALRHLGLYAYRVSALQRLAAAPPSRLEQTEGLEQLRALEMGLTIVAPTAPEPAPPGIDTPADLAAARARVDSP